MLSRLVVDIVPHSRIRYHYEEVDHRPHQVEIPESVKVLEPRALSMSVLQELMIDRYSTVVVMILCDVAVHNLSIHALMQTQHAFLVVVHQLDKVVLFAQNSVV